MNSLIRTYRWPLLVALAAVAVRWIYLFELASSPGFHVPMVDEKWHWEWAKEIIHTSFLGDGTWFRAPLYPYLLALLAWATNESVLWSKLLQVFVCGGTGFFVYRLGERLFGGTVGLFAGLIYAVYGTLIYYESMFLVEILFLFFLVWGIYRLVAFGSAEGWRSWILTGAVFGLAAISRPNILLVVPVLIAWVFWVSPRRLTLVQRLRKPLLLLVGLVVTIAPVTVRNVVVTGDFTLISSQGGVNLYLGNNPMANGLSMRMPEVELSESLSWRQFQPATLAAAERLSGRDLTEGEASDFWTQRALTFIKENPGAFAGLLWRKTVYLLSGFENSDNSDIYYERGKSKIYSLLLWDGPIDFPFGLLLPLALLGIYIKRKEARKLLPVYLFLIAYIPTIILFLVTARHRMPLLPFLMILGVAGVVAGIELIRRRRYRDVAVGGALCLVALLLFNRTYYEEGGRNDFQIHFNAGIKEEHLGNLAAAEAEYVIADRHFAGSPALLTNLGHVQFQLGKLDEADRTFARALAIEPSFHRTLNNLGLLVESRGMADSALALFMRARQNFDSEIAPETELGQIHMNIGRALEATGRAAEARPHFDSTLLLAPQWPKGVYQAAAFFARQEQFDVSDSLFKRGRLLFEPSASDYFNWGLSYMQRKMYDHALNMLGACLKKDPNLAPAHYLVGVAHYEGGMAVDSVMPHLNTALRIDPQYAPAAQFRQFLMERGAGGR